MMNTEHVKVFAEIYLEEKSWIDSVSFKAFMYKEVQLPVTQQEILDALNEMCIEKKLKLEASSPTLSRYRKL
jgi:hypothetical protein